MTEYSIIGIVFFLGSLFAGAGIVVSYLIAPKGADTGMKREPYECGEETIGHSNIQFKIGYYLFALLFMIFDVESVFLYPGLKIFRAVVDGQMPPLTVTLMVGEILIFIVILVFGLVYAWKKKILEWE